MANGVDEMFDLDAALPPGGGEEAGGGGSRKGEQGTFFLTNPDDCD